MFLCTFKDNIFAFIFLCSRFDYFFSLLVFLNLSSVLLRFTRPICKGVGNSKLMKIDPTYTSVDCKVSEDAFLKNVHLRKLKDETFLLPSTEEEKDNDNVPDQFNFVTDIFFLAHKSLDLGFRVCHEKFVKMNQELGRLQQGEKKFEFVKLIS